MNDPLFESSSASFETPLAMLRACHARMERQIATLQRLRRHLPEHGADAQARSAARAILRYFDGAAPMHHADEEASVFPRLVAHRPEAARPVAELADQHQRLEAHWRRLRALLSGISAGQRANLPPKDIEEFADAYATHLERENTWLLPLCDDALRDEDLAAIGREMAARREA
jgi:hemerythrin-like domain-containing protein